MKFTFEHALVTEIHDGDTGWATIDLGFSLSIKAKFRLARINAPELGTPGAKEATDALVALVLNKQVQIASTTLDKYGRLLAEVVIDAVNVSDELLKQGLVKEYK